MSVAVGSQLGDVFLHLLPEAFAHPHASTLHIGLWTLIGLFLFFLIEQIFPEDENNEDDQSTDHQSTKQNQIKVNSSSFLDNRIELN